MITHDAPKSDTAIIGRLQSDVHDLQVRFASMETRMAQKNGSTWVRWAIGGLSTVVFAMIVWMLNTQVTRFYKSDGDVLSARVSVIERDVARIPSEIPPPWFKELVYSNQAAIKSVADDVSEIKSIIREHTAANHSDNLR